MYVINFDKMKKFMQSEVEKIFKKDADECRIILDEANAIYQTLRTRQHFYKGKGKVY